MRDPKKASTVYRPRRWRDARDRLAFISVVLSFKVRALDQKVRLIGILNQIPTFCFSLQAVKHHQSQAFSSQVGANKGTDDTENVSFGADLRFIYTQ